MNLDMYASITILGVFAISCLCVMVAFAIHERKNVYKQRRFSIGDEVFFVSNNEVVGVITETVYDKRSEQWTYDLHISSLNIHIRVLQKMLLHVRKD